MSSAGSKFVKDIKELAPKAPVNFTIAPRELPMVEAHELAAARNLIDTLFIELCGKTFSSEYRAAGYFVAVRLFVRDDEIMEGKREDGTSYKILRPQASTDEDKYQATTGLVCDVGPWAYKDPQRYPEGPWCRVGDFVHVPRHEAIPFSLNGVAMGLVADDRILGVVRDPSSVELIKQASRF